MKRLCTALAIVLALVQPASGQEFSEKVEQTLDSVQARKMTKVAELIKLDEDEMEVFQDLYDEFQELLQKENERYTEIAWQYLDQSKEMTDERALALVRDYLKLEEDRASLKKSYLVKIEKVLPPVQFVHLFQLENKADALFKYHLATHIPFLE